MEEYIVDFEFRSDPGCKPHPWCLVAVETSTGKIIRLWLDGAHVPSPFPPFFRMIAHYAMAELACFDALGWNPPTEVVDTLAEARTVYGQVSACGGWGLLSVATRLGIPTLSAEHKTGMRTLAMGGIVSPEERRPLMDYCHADVMTTLAVFEKLRPQIDTKFAVLRGRFLKALARVESRGIPCDSDLIGKLDSRWEDLRNGLRSHVRHRYYGCFSEKGSFSAKGWQHWCEANQIPWLTLGNGKPCLDESTFKKMADRYPEVREMAYTRKLLGQMRPPAFSLGPDGRMRTMLAPFGSDTSRNQPSNSRYVFGMSAWLRSVIQPGEDKVLAYVDFSSQEFVLAAALAGDDGMVADYQSGDPYVSFAKRVGAIPPPGTKDTHPTERANFKIAALAVQYGMQAESLSATSGLPLPTARRLIEAHRSAYPKFWVWRQALVDMVMTGETISTRLGWNRRMRSLDSGTSAGNFLIQASGAEILRLAIIGLEEAGHRVVAPVHDAVLVELPADGYEVGLHEVRSIMSKAASFVTGGIEIRTDAEITLPGQHFEDKRGREMWQVVAPILGINFL